MNNGPVAEATSTQLADAKHPRFRAALVIAFFALLWLGLWRQLSGEWSVNDQYSYGWFVPFFAIVLFWLRFEGANFTAGGREPLANRSREAGDSDLVKAEGWDDKPKAESGKRKPESGKLRAESLSHITRHMSQAAVALCCLLLLFPIRLFEIGNPDWRPLDWLHALCVVAITLVFLWWIGGKPWLKHFLFPVAFTLVAVPWVTPIEEPIVQGLMRLVANIASEAAALFGIPTSVQGNLIRIPSGLLGVNEACSGVRSLQTSLMIGLLFGELKRLPVAKRVM
ncbi:MAG TPA: exosortase/archaeosortase family protein, partial [Chthoniobacterales bacterium]|nr:exosortase/archaeosortase family protein [Chthoniobacterales bacterium]